MTSTPEQSWQTWFENIWADREDRVYREIFGTFSAGIFRLQPELFHQLGCAEVDPRWLTHAVLESPPQPDRDSWVYLTTALSNPWGQKPTDIQPGQYSGLGCEFLLQTRQRAAWPVRVLQWLMAVEILTASGKLSGEMIEPGDRIALGGPIDAPGGSALNHLLIAAPENMATNFELASGRVDFFLCVGITAAEMQFAQAQGSAGLCQLLRHHAYLPVTDPQRPSAV